MSFENDFVLPTPNLEFSFSQDFFIRKENSYQGKFDRNFDQTIPFSTSSKLVTKLQLSEVENHFGPKIKISNANESLNSIDHFSNLSFLEKLGEGSFGDVFMVRDETEDKYYAVKRTKRRKVRINTNDSHRSKEIINIQSIGDHVNLVKLICFWEDYSFMFMQFDLCSSSLKDFLSIHGPVMLSDIWWMLKDISTGLSHIHDNEFIHLDIKPANLFLSLDHKTVKIGDFGLLFHLSDLSQNASEGDNMYMAPELLRRVFSKPADIFSLGLTILELITNLDLPKQGILWHKLRQDDLPAFLNRFPLSIITIITKMLQSIPENRIQLSEIIFTCNSEITQMNSKKSKFYFKTSIIFLISNLLLTLLKLFIADPFYNIWKKIFSRSLLPCLNFDNCTSTSDLVLQKISKVNICHASPSISKFRCSEDLASEFIHLTNNSINLTSTPNQNNSYPYVFDKSPSFEVEKVEDIPTKDFKPLDQSYCVPRKLYFD